MSDLIVVKSVLCLVFERERSGYRSDRRASCVACVDAASVFPSAEFNVTAKSPDTVARHILVCMMVVAWHHGGQKIDMRRGTLSLFSTQVLRSCPGLKWGLCSQANLLDLKRISLVLWWAVALVCVSSLAQMRFAQLFGLWPLPSPPPTPLPRKHTHTHPSTL